MRFICQCRGADAQSLRVSFLFDDSKATPLMTNSRVALGTGCPLDEAFDLLARAGLTYFLFARAGFMYFLLAIAGFT